jgi:hypothetical protein
MKLKTKLKAGADATPEDLIKSTSFVDNWRTQR